MKKILFSSLVFVFAFVVVGGVADAKSEKAQGPHEKATGSITAMAGSTSLELIFDAHGTAPVKGNVEYSNSRGGNFSGTVNVCYHQDGNKAAFAGEITDGTYDNKYFLIEVTDNGEGENAESVDAVRVVVNDKGYECKISNNFPGKVTEGNLQVHQVKEESEEVIVPEIMSAVEDEEIKGKKPAKKCTTIQSGGLEASDGSTIETGFDEWGYNYQAHLFNGGYCDAYRDDAWCQPWKDVNLSMKWNDAWLSNEDCDGDDLLDRHLGYDTYIGSGAWITNHQSDEYDEWNLVGDWMFDYDYNGNSYPHEVHITSQDAGIFEAIGMGLNDSNPWTATGTVSGDDFTLRVEYDNTAYWVDVVGVIASDGSMSGTWGNTGQSGTWSSIGGSSQSCEWDYFVKIVAVPSDATASAGVWYDADGERIGIVIWGQFAIIQEVANDTCYSDDTYSVHERHPGLGNWEDKIMPEGV